MSPAWLSASLSGMFRRIVRTASPGVRELHVECSPAISERRLRAPVAHPLLRAARLPEGRSRGVPSQPLRTSAKYALVVAMLGLWNVMVPSAQAAPRGLSPLEVREQFAQCGYEIGNPGS